MKLRDGYNVLVSTKHFCHMINCRKLKTARFIMNLKCFPYSRIMDRSNGLVIELKNNRKKSKG